MDLIIYTIKQIIKNLFILINYILQACIGFFFVLILYLIYIFIYFQNNFYIEINKKINYNEYIQNNFLLYFFLILIIFNIIYIVKKNIILKNIKNFFEILFFGYIIRNIYFIISHIYINLINYKQIIYETLFFKIIRIFDKEEILFLIKNYLITKNLDINQENQILIELEKQNLIKNGANIDDIYIIIDNLIIKLFNQTNNIIIEQKNTWLSNIINFLSNHTEFIFYLGCIGISMCALHIILENYNLYYVLQKTTERDFISQNSELAFEIFSYDVYTPIFMRHFAYNPDELLLNLQYHPELTYKMVWHCPELVLIQSRLLNDVNIYNIICEKCINYLSIPNDQAAIIINNLIQSNMFYYNHFALLKRFTTYLFFEYDFYEYWY